MSRVPFMPELYAALDETNVDTAVVTLQRAALGLVRASQPLPKGLAGLPPGEAAKWVLLLRRCRD